MELHPAQLDRRLHVLSLGQRLLRVVFGSPRAASIDWGQDLLSRRDWISRHPDAHPLYFDCLGSEVVCPSKIGREPVPTDLAPGWYALSVDRLHDPYGKYNSFMDLEPTYMIGYSIYLYRIEDINRPGRCRRR